MKELLKNRIKIITLLIICIGCDNNREYTKIVDSKKLFVTKGNNETILSGSHFFYDKNGNLLADYIFLENSDSVLHYQMTIRNSHKQIVYFCEYKNGDVLREFDWFSFDTISKMNGSFLNDSYCKYCHNNENSIGPSLWSLSRLSKENFLRSFRSTASHDTIPKITEKQLLSLEKYIRSSSD